MKSAILGSSSKTWITEGALVEILKRNPTIRLNPKFVHALLIYEESGKQALKKLWSSYLDSALAYSLPILCFTATWRANQILLSSEGLLDRPVNEDNARFLQEILRPYKDKNLSVKIGGLLSCVGDCYKPDQALGTEKAIQVHSFQAQKLAESGCDFLFGSTLPALTEALGLASAMADTKKPYVLSFVVRPTGKILDGTLISDVIRRIDDEASAPPDFYMVNCVHPQIFDLAAKNDLGLKAVEGRLVGLQANTSALSPEELDGSPELHSEDPNVFAENILSSLKTSHLRVVGGCCGTDSRHIDAIAKRL